MYSKFQFILFSFSFILFSAYTYSDTTASETGKIEASIAEAERPARSTPDISAASVSDPLTQSWAYPENLEALRQKANSGNKSAQKQILNLAYRGIIPFMHRTLDRLLPSSNNFFGDGEVWLLHRMKNKEDFQAKVIKVARDAPKYYLTYRSLEATLYEEYLSDPADYKREEYQDMTLLDGLTDEDKSNIMNNLEDKIKSKFAYLKEDEKDTAGKKRELKDLADGYEKQGAFLIEKKSYVMSSLWSDITGALKQKKSKGITGARSLSRSASSILITVFMDEVESELRSRAEKGDLDAYNWVGILLHVRGTASSMMIKSFFHEGEKKNHAPSTNNLGLRHYADAVYEPRAFQLTIDLFCAAASQGLYEGKINLMWALYKGVTRTPPKNDDRPFGERDYLTLEEADMYFRLSNMQTPPHCPCP